MPSDGSHLLELRYHFAERPPRGAMSLEMPRLGRGAWVRRLYWQLILPRDEHLLAAPEGFAGEQAGLGTATAGAAGRCWTRPSWRIGWARRRGLAPAGQSNEYLFSALRQRRPLRRVYRPAAAWIVLLASGAALLAGLLLIYVRRLRHPAALLRPRCRCWPPAWSTRNRRAGGAGRRAGTDAGPGGRDSLRGIARQQQRAAAAEKASSVVEAAPMRVPSPPRPPAGDGSTPTQNLPAVVLPSPPDSTP